MIGDIFLNTAFGFISFIISLFPTSTGFPSDVGNAMTTIGGYFGMFAPLIPMGTLLSVLLLVFGAEIGVFAFRTVKWFISHIPFIGGNA